MTKITTRKDFNKIKFEDFNKETINKIEEMIIEWIGKGIYEEHLETKPKLQVIKEDLNWIFWGYEDDEDETDFEAIKEFEAIFYDFDNGNHGAYHFKEIKENKGDKKCIVKNII